MGNYEVPVTLLAFSCLLLAALAVLAYRIDRSAWAPATVYSAVWFVALGIVWLAGDFFYPISANTLCIYDLGAICFALGSFLHVRPLANANPPTQEKLRKGRSMVLGALILLIVLFPVFILELLRMAGSAPGDNPWMSIRNALIEIEATPGGGPFSLAMNLPEIAIGVAFVAVCLRIRKGCSRLLETGAICMALLYQVLTAARYGVFLLMVCIIVLRAMAPGANWRRMARTVLPFVLGFAVLFFVNQITLSKGIDKTYNTLADSIDLVEKEAVVHAVGGLVGFDQVVANRETIVANQDIDVFFVHTLNKLGAQFQEFSRNSDPLLVASPIYFTNVYTIYFCFWPHYGLPGTMALMFFLGWFAKWCYLKSRSGHDVCAILYALTINALVMSVLADEFFLTLNGWLKFAFIGFLAFGWARCPVAKAASAIMSPNDSELLANPSAPITAFQPQGQR